MRKGILFLFLATGLLSTNVQAQDRVFAALTGHGFEDIYNFGFGIRIGKNFTLLDTPLLFLGGVGVFHQGKTQSRTFPSQTGKNEIVETTDNVAYFGGEIGINIKLKAIMLRPSALLAYARVSKDIPQFDVEGRFFMLLEEDKTDFFVAPGANIAIPLGNIALGGDVRYLNVPDEASWAVYSTLSFRF